MKFFPLSTKSCTRLFFLSCLLLCALPAWRYGVAHGMETVWVPLERIADAAATVPLERPSVPRALLAAAPVFLGGLLAAVPLTELYHAALAHFRGES